MVNKCSKRDLWRDIGLPLFVSLSAFVIGKIIFKEASERIQTPPQIAARANVCPSCQYSNVDVNTWRYRENGF